MLHSLRCIKIRLEPIKKFALPSLNDFAAKVLLTRCWDDGLWSEAVWGNDGSVTDLKGRDAEGWALSSTKKRKEKETPKEWQTDWESGKEELVPQQISVSEDWFPGAIFSHPVRLPLFLQFAARFRYRECIELKTEPNNPTPSHHIFWTCAYFDNIVGETTRLCMPQYIVQASALQGEESDVTFERHLKFPWRAKVAGRRKVVCLYPRFDFSEMPWIRNGKSIGRRHQLSRGTGDQRCISQPLLAAWTLLYCQECQQWSWLQFESYPRGHEYNWAEEYC